MGTDPSLGNRNFHIIFFDGVCNLCNGFVDFILKRDHRGDFRFASLQSETAAELLPDDALPGKEDSVILLTSDGTIHRRSDAVLTIASILGGGWSLAHGFRIIPRGLRDRIYTWIANHRYSWFGKRDTCRLPTEAEKERFL